MHEIHQLLLIVLRIEFFFSHLGRCSFFLGLDPLHESIRPMHEDRSVLHLQLIIFPVIEDCCSILFSVSACIDAGTGVAAEEGAIGEEECLSGVGTGVQ
jgi:hypothetical protein